MRIAALSFLVGMSAFHQLTFIPSRSVLWLIPIAICCIVYTACIPRTSILRWFVILIGWSLAGFLYALYWFIPPITTQLPAELEGVDLTVRGWIASIPRPFYRYTQFDFDVDEIHHRDQKLPLNGKLRLSWYKDDKTQTLPDLRVGDYWHVTVRIKRPRGLANPGGFDTARWAIASHLFGKGYIRPKPEPQFIAKPHPYFRYAVDQFRQRITEQFQTRTPNAYQAYTGILTALAVGERGGISNDQWQRLQHTGTAHLIAISGLHVGLIAGLIFVAIRRLWACIPRLAFYWPASQAAAFTAIIGAGGYALLAGLPIPTQRAVIMLTVVMTAVLLRRSLSVDRLLALALFVVLWLEPQAPLQAGFWLSFGAIAAIFYVLRGRYPGVSEWQIWWNMQWAILIALLPISLFVFNKVILIAPLANLIAIPWASVTIIPLALIAALVGTVSETLQIACLALAGWAMNGLWHFLGHIEGLAHSWELLPIWPAPPLWAIGLTLLGVLILLMPRGLPGRSMGIVLCLPLFFFPQPTPPMGSVWFTMLDVGNGLSTVIRTTNHLLVYDTGPRPADLDSEEIPVIRFIRNNNLHHVDKLIISQKDSHHRGGTRAVLTHLKVDQVFTLNPLEVPVEGAQPCRTGQVWEWDEVHFEILHPPSDHWRDNDGSCVLKVTSRYGRILLPGDIEKGAENNLLQTRKADLAAEILIAPHHGYRALSLPAFIEAVAPHYVLFSTGYKNQWNYPRPETITLYQKTGATLLNTAEHGAITFRLDGKTEQPELYRQQMRSYWRVP